MVWLKQLNLSGFTQVCASQYFITCVTKIHCLDSLCVSNCYEGAIMITFIATIHIISCIVLIGLVLVQDSKGGGVFTSQTSSNSVLGATGANSLAATLTKIFSVIVGVSCIVLAMMSAKTQKSVVDSGVLPTTPVNAAAAVSTTATTASATTEATSSSTTNK